MKLYQNQAIKEASDCLQHISKNSDFHIDLSPRELKLEFDQIFFILYICVKLQQNWSMNEGARAITMCEGNR